MVGPVSRKEPIVGNYDYHGNTQSTHIMNGKLKGQNMQNSKGHELDIKGIKHDGYYPSHDMRPLILEAGISGRDK